MAKQQDDYWGFIRKSGKDAAKQGRPRIVPDWVAGNTTGVPWAVCVASDSQIAVDLAF